ncbi:MAG: metalloendopeptidase-like rane protein [Proteobacteria bacterium]|nr:metalloendopeptidase-like rane protein [Pseudomonadota bacterium]
MREGLSLLRTVAVLGAMCTLFVGCASKAPAPLETRTPSASAGITPAESASPAVARPGYYIVKKGDTLYSIAHQYERDYREVAAWNGLIDPNVIKVGQELRVVSPTESAGVKPIASPVVIESKPIPAPAAITFSSGSAARSSVPPAAEPAPAASTTSAATAGQKTEPKGGRIAYSEQAWKDLQTADKPVPAVQMSAAQSKPAENKQTESKPLPGTTDENVDWIWPGNGKVLAGFNDSSNKGVDLAGSVGDPVMAAGNGRVVYVGSGLRGYGNLVIIKHNNNFLSAYAHNSEILVKEGQMVQKGQKIAALGSSDTDRPKLHFEIRRQGKPVDPMKYLPTR